MSRSVAGERPGVSFLVAGLFYLSGACGLVYEVAWTRMFAVTAGGATRALTAVLVAYMGGLALGSFLGGRWVDRRARRPVLAYGALEGMIGVLAVVLSFAIPWLLPVLKLGRSVVGQETLLFDFYRFMVSALALVLPTTLMGATFPILLRGVLADRERFGFTTGLLYSANTLGAMTGSFASGFFLIPALGLRAATWLAAGTNFLILAVILIWPRLRNLTASPEVLERQVPKKKSAPQEWLIWVVIGGYGVSGLCAMIYQVGWARVLSLSLGNSTYTLGLIFAAYIGGLALGGMAIAPWADRVRRPLLWAAALEVAIGITALLVMPLFEEVTARMFTWALKFQNSFQAFQTVRFFSAFALVLLPTLAMGALFPVVVRLAGQLRRGVGEPTGQVYAGNTVGAILGAFVAGHVLIRWFGVHTALLIATGLSVLVGMVWLWLTDLSQKSRALGAGALAGGAGLLILLTPAWDPILMNSGPYMYAEVFRDQLEKGEDIRDILHGYDKVIFNQEDMEATVSVLEFLYSGDLYLRINGKTDASSKVDLPSQVLCAEIPLLLHPAPKKVMMLGLASGVSAGSALLHPIERLDCLEISPAVVKASAYFERVNHLNYQDPRFHLILDDARNYLALTDEKYDVIVTESTNPWISGISTLFTREFFTLLRSHLSPGGLALAFLPLYDMDVNTAQMVLRSFSAAFPYCALWESIPGADYFVVGSDRPFQVNLEEVLTKTRDPAIAADLSRLGVHNGAELFARFVMGPAGINRVKGTGPLHVDDRRQLEYLVPKLKSRPQAPRVVAIFRDIFSGHEPASVIFPPSLPEEMRLQFAGYDRARAAYYQASLQSVAADPQRLNLEGLIRSWKDVLALCDSRFPCDYALKELSAWVLSRAELKMQNGEEEAAIADYAYSWELNPDDAMGADRLIEYYRGRGDNEPTKLWAERALMHLPKDGLAVFALGEVALKTGDLPAAEKYFREMVDIAPNAPDGHFYLALTLARQGRLAEAETELRSALEQDPKQVDTLLLLYDVLRSQGRDMEGRKYLSRAKKLAPNHPKIRELEGR